MIVADESILLREINHRMMNSLTIISLGIERELNRIDGADNRRLRRHSQRILDHAEIYRCLCLRGTSSSISLERYFSRLCRSLARAILSPLGVECVVALEPGVLSSAQCERLGMIVTELVFNAAKHAFNGRRGRLRISVRRDAEGWCCSVEDNGCGFGVRNSGYGSHLVEALVASLGGTFAAASGPDGCGFTIKIPVSLSGLGASAFGLQINQ